MIKYSVYLSPLADFKLIHLLQYLELEWGIKTKKSFLMKLKKATDQISIAPESCERSSDFKGVFKCIVSKRTSFYYRILEVAREIEVITVVDNRQDPKRVAEEIEKYFG